MRTSPTPSTADDTFFAWPQATACLADDANAILERVHTVHDWYVLAILDHFHADRPDPSTRRGRRPRLRINLLLHQALVQSLVHAQARADFGAGAVCVL